MTHTLYHIYYLTFYRKTLLIPIYILIGMLTLCFVIFHSVTQQYLLNTYMLPTLWEMVGWKAGNLNTHNTSWQSTSIFQTQPALLTDVSQASTHLVYSLQYTYLQYSTERLMQECPSSAAWWRDLVVCLFCWNWPVSPWQPFIYPHLKNSFCCQF